MGAMTTTTTRRYLAALADLSSTTTTPPTRGAGTARSARRMGVNVVPTATAAPTWRGATGASGHTAEGALEKREAVCVSCHLEMPRQAAHEC